MKKDNPFRIVTHIGDKPILKEYAVHTEHLQRGVYKVKARSKDEAEDMFSETFTSYHQVDEGYDHNELILKTEEL
jgi:hypothetical protein